MLVKQTEAQMNNQHQPDQHELATREQFERLAVAMGVLLDQNVTIIQLLRRRQRRRALKRRSPQQLTAKQAQALLSVTRHDGDCAAAGDEFRISRQAMEQRYAAAVAKLH